MISRRLFRRRAAALLAVALAACHHAPEKAARHSITPASVAWRHGDIDGALADAKMIGRPVLLYWGAAWCAPCAKLKATVFKDPAFVELTQHLVPIYLDGDNKDAQVAGERFHLKGYPTLLLLRPDGIELSRPDTMGQATTIVAALRAAIGGTTPLAELTNRALVDPSRLSTADWRRLGEGDWMIRVFSAEPGVSDTLRHLSAIAPDPVLRRRFGVAAMIPLAAPSNLTHFTPVSLSLDQARAIEDLLRPTVSPSASIGPQDGLLAYFESRLVAALPPSSDKQALTVQLQHDAATLRTSGRISLPDRIDTLAIDITLARNNGPTVPPAIVAAARTFSEAAVARTTDPVLLASVLHEAALVRRDAGDVEGVHQMLLGALPRLTNPIDSYERLSENAEMRGKPAEAVAWIAREYRAEHGPASRLRFAIDYSNIAMRLFPDDKAGVKRSADAVIAASTENSGDASVRTRKMVQKWRERFVAWNAAHGASGWAARLAANLPPSSEPAHRHP